MFPYTCLECGHFFELRKRVTFGRRHCPHCNREITADGIDTQLCILVCVDCGEPRSFNQVDAPAIAGKRCKHCARLIAAEEVTESVREFHSLLSETVRDLYHADGKIVRFELVNERIKAVLEATANARRQKFSELERMRNETERASRISLEAMAEENRRQQEHVAFPPSEIDQQQPGKSFAVIIGCVVLVTLILFWLNR